MRGLRAKPGVTLPAQHSFYHWAELQGYAVFGSVMEAPKKRTDSGLFWNSEMVRHVLDLQTFMFVLTNSDRSARNDWQGPPLP